MRLEVRDLAKIKVEDMALAGGYFVLFGLIDSVNLNGVGNFHLDPFESAWPAIAVLGCMGVLFRRSSPAAMAWMCGVAVVGLVLAGHSGAFVLAFELFFSLVLFGSPRASQIASKTAWVLTIGAVVATFVTSQDGALTVMVGIIAVVTLLTPVEWAGNLRKAQELVNSEHTRANAVEEASHQRLLAERSAHDLILDRERQHMARELHDVLSARLSAIALQSGAVLHAPAPSAASPALAAHRDLLTQIRAESVAGLAELNDMIRLLHTGAAAETTGQLSDLNALARRHRDAGMELSYSNDLHDAGTRLPLSLQSAVYRVASEALVNAAKHAPSSPVQMRLTRQGGTVQGGTGQPRTGDALHPELVLTVTTPLPTIANGNTAPIPTGTGTGVPSMHFRAAHAGGTVMAGPAGGAWLVELRLPLNTDLDAPHHGNTQSQANDKE